VPPVPGRDYGAKLNWVTERVNEGCGSR
jgi:hypothetical protein